MSIWRSCQLALISELEAARRMDSCDAMGGQDLVADQFFHDPRNRFEAQVRDVGDILPHRQNDVATGVREQSDEPDDTVDRFTAA